MFLLKRATTVVLLVTLFGILLTDLYIQPAQGFSCYDCKPCKSRTDLGDLIPCDRSTFDYCWYGEREKEDGKKYPERGCAKRSFVNNHDCKTFTNDNLDWPNRVRVCSCDTDRCNYLPIGEDSPAPPGGGHGPGPSPCGASSASSQLLLILCLPVAIYTFGSLMN